MRSARVWTSSLIRGKHLLTDRACPCPEDEPGINRYQVENAAASCETRMHFLPRTGSKIVAATASLRKKEIETTAGSNRPRVRRITSIFDPETIILSAIHSI